ncbi:MAG: hypothetical protein GYA16_09460 [Spirochaetes bacterium]|nr:hypothetical protein [Spirochaetota bacterium]
MARVYRKDKVATVSGSTSSSGYVIAISANDVYGNPQTIADYFLDDDDPLIWGRPLVYPPAKPSVKVGTVEGLLDYYLRYEQYKIEYNDFVDAVDGGSYETLWNNYNDYKWSLRLPPLVAHSNGGGYTLTNVPYGDYLFYFVADASVLYGTLPDVDNVVNEKSVSVSMPVVNNVDFP